MEPPAKLQRRELPDGVSAAEAFVESVKQRFGQTSTSGSRAVTPESVPDLETDDVLDLDAEAEADNMLDLDAKTETNESISYAKKYETHKKEWPGAEKYHERVWLDTYRALTEFVKQKGKIPAMRTVWEWKGEKWKLGFWVNNQRQAYKTKRILAERANLLELVPGWVWAVRGSKHRYPPRKWDRWLELLHEFVAHHGRVPASNDVWLDGLRLCSIGVWCTTQQRWQNENLLSAERRQKLSAVPGWKWANEDVPAQRNIDDDEKWAENAEVLREYVAAHNTLPGRVPVRNGSIGQWIKEQQQKYHMNRLTEEQIATLESIPLWEWQNVGKEPLSFVYRWNEWLETLCEYVRLKKSLPFWSTVWMRSDGSKWKIGNWIGSQRRKYRKNMLTHEQINALEAVDGWEWGDTNQLTAKKESVNKRTWDEWYKVLDEYVKINNAMPKSSTIWTDQYGKKWHLGVWAAHQRSRRRLNLMAQRRVAQLEEIPGWNWERRSKGVRFAGLNAELN